MRRQARQPGLDLCVAIGTEQHALCHLCSRRSQRASNTLHAQVEALAAGIHVMEVKSSAAAVVPAQQARSARLVDEDRLHLAPPLTDVLHPPPLPPFVPPPPD